MFPHGHPTIYCYPTSVPPETVTPTSYRLKTSSNCNSSFASFFQQKSPSFIYQARFTRS